MRRAVTYFIYLVVFVVLLLLPSALRYLRYYGLDGVERQEPPVYEPASVPARVPTPAAGDFVDDPEVGHGWVLLDAAHDNRFELAEISYLDSRLAARGYELRTYKEGDLATALRPVSAFVTIAPMAAYDEEQILALTDFVERGGRLLLVGDPTRFELIFEEEEDFDPFSYSIDSDDIALNSLANAFDLVFNGDYLYNTVDNEGNFQNIVLDQDGMADSALTEGLEQLAFYGSHSSQAGPDGRPLLSADDDTWSSATDRSGGLALGALGADDRVLALGDIEFLSEPYYTVYDNSRFISQMADFLTGAERDFVLTDFPFFYGDEIDLVYTGDPELGPNAFDEVVGLQEALGRSGRQLSLVDEPGDQASVLYAGLYNQSEELADILETAGVTLIIDPPVETEPAADDEPTEEEDGAGSETDESSAGEEEEKTRRITSDLGDVQMAGTALILFVEEGESRQVIVLAASAEGLDNTLDRLIRLGPLAAEPALDDCLVQDDMALCPTGVADEIVEAELVTSDLPEEEPTAATPPSEEPAPEEPEPEATPAGPGASDLDAEILGPIFLGDSIDETLDEDQAHGWLFAGGPAVVNIILQAGDDMDGVLELYDADGGLLAAADSAFEGEEERLDLIDFEAEQVYTIVVRDFFNDGGSYTLNLVAVTPEELGAVDQGDLAAGEPVSGALAEGETHAWAFAVDLPAEATIVLASGPELDGLFILFGPDGAVLEIVDETLTGDEEQLTAYSLEELGEYTIVVGEYADGGGDYTLTLELSE
ncbi:MAG: hypothetical protein JSW55_18035 [Chloroflexota bacterium]|nr:MAG: hypothetical protein JSW55_18035 [Chloroflexota bacterium]